MKNIDELRKELDDFIVSENGDMTSEKVVAKSIEIENRMFALYNLSKDVPRL